MVAPVVNPAAGDARYTAAPTSSDNLPNRPIGVRAIASALRASDIFFSLIGVMKKPGAIALMRTPLAAHSAASDCVSYTTAHLVIP